MMEDFASARATERPENTNRLLAEWQESQLPNCKLELAAAKPGKDCPRGPGKDVADRLDGELRQFANTPRAGASDKMVEFQKLVNKFEDAADKKAAISDFGNASAKLRVSMEKDAEATYHKMEAEAGKVPGRKEMQADYSAKLNKFFDQVNKLPTKENERVMNLMEVKPGESIEQRNERVRDGIKDRPALLKSFNSMEDASARIEASRTPVEKELAKQHQRDIDEAHVIKAIVTKAAIRADIKV